MKTLKEITHKKPLIEIDNLEANTELARKTLKKMKYDFLRNVFYVLLGAFISIIATKLSSNTPQKETLKESKNMRELNQLIKSHQIHLYKMQLELNELKTSHKNLVDFGRKD